MIIAWMIFATAIGLLFTGAAIAAEGLAHTFKLPTRFVWALAMLMTIVWPIVLRIGGATAVPDPGAHSSMTVSMLKRIPPVPMVSGFVSLHTAVSRILTGHMGHLLGIGFLVMWGLLSFILLGQLLFTMGQLRRWRHTWQRAEIDGVAVRLSSDVGPALIGIRSMEIVIPEWVLAFDVPLKRLILRHEQEHRSAGDPLMLLLTTLLVALVPWNIALWWQSRRLRLAIEVDCDDRVLLKHPQQERYGLLLLALVQRRTNAPTQFAPTLVESTSHLERRIIAMRNRTLPISRLHALRTSIVVIAAITLACNVQPPTPPLIANHNTPLANHVSEMNVDSVMQVVPDKASPTVGQKVKARNDITTLNVDYVMKTAPGKTSPTARQKVEARNDITTLVVDSVMKTAPSKTAPSH